MPQFIIRNFQSISEAKLRVEGLTLLVGESSSGKTACFRAIFAAANNRFRNGQVKNGQDSAVVKIQMPDSPDCFTAIRPWSGSIKMALGQEKFDKIGRNLPRQIDEFFQFGTLDVGGEKFSLNFHDQFQKPLLLEFSQQRVMEILSASKGIDDLNFAKDTIQDLRVQNKGAFRAIDAVLTEAKENLSTTKRVYEQVSPLVQSLDSEYEVYSILNESLQKALQLEEYLNVLTTVSLKIDLHIRLQKELSDGLSLHGSFVQLDENLNILAEYDTLLRKVNTKYDCVRIYRELSSISTEKQESQLASCIELSSLFSESFDDRKLLTKITVCRTIQNLKECSSEFTTINALIATLESQLTQLSTIRNRIGELNEIVINHVCPVCHSKVIA